MWVILYVCSVWSDHFSTDGSEGYMNILSMILTLEMSYIIECKTFFFLKDTLPILRSLVSTNYLFPNICTCYIYLTSFLEDVFYPSHLNHPEKARRKSVAPSPTYDTKWGDISLVTLKITIVLNVGSTTFLTTFPSLSMILRRPPQWGFQFLVRL